MNMCQGFYLLQLNTGRTVICKNENMSCRDLYFPLDKVHLLIWTGIIALLSVSKI